MFDPLNKPLKFYKHKNMKNEITKYSDGRLLIWPEDWQNSIADSDCAAAIDHNIVGLIFIKKTELKRILQKYNLVFLGMGVPYSKIYNFKSR